MRKRFHLPLPLAERLREVRHDRGLTQMDLARICRMSYTTISQFETGARTPCLANLTKVAKALDVSIDYLVGRTDNRAAHLFPGEHLRSLGLDHRDLELLETIASRLVNGERPDPA